MLKTAELPNINTYKIDKNQGGIKMGNKYSVNPETKAEIKGTIFELFKSGCPICFSDDGSIEDSSYNLPIDYRERLLSSLYEYEEKDVALSVGGDIQFIIDIIDQLPKGTKVYWVHDIWRSKEIWVVHDLNLAKKCVESIINYEFSLEPTCYAYLERKINVRKERIARIENITDTQNYITVLEIKKEIKELQERLEETITDYENSLNNSFAIEVLVAGDNNSGKLNKYTSLKDESTERKRWNSQGLIYNPNLKLQRKTGC